MNYEMINGLVLAIFLISIMIAPIYCCQVSDDEYQKIMSNYYQRKKK
jgi:hypothetical protein